jgi:DnaJ-domain-containing protein 1
MQHNPFIIPILDILKNAEQRVGEYDLIRQLEQQGFDFGVADHSYQMAVFRKHFVTMNALYELQASLLDEGIYLSITALDIQMQATRVASSSHDISDQAEQRVRDYYLDWRNLHDTTEQDVRDLLDSFWNMYFSGDKVSDALDVLGLDESSDWAGIRRRYQKLAGQFHPDKGGDQQRFMEVREAYEILRTHYN